MRQLALVARLKKDAAVRAAELLASGPPFEPEQSGLVRHTVYLSAAEAVFVFEGPDVDTVVDELMVDDPFCWEVRAALDEWRPLLDGEPHIARPAFVWERSASPEPARS
jgi:hypothetical protein